MGRVRAGQLMLVAPEVIFVQKLLENIICFFAFSSCVAACLSVI